MILDKYTYSKEVADLDQYFGVAQGELAIVLQDEMVEEKALLRDEADLAAMAAILREAYPLDKDTVLLAMGHGTTHSANGLYLRLARHMAPDMALCTVEGRPSFREAVDALLAQPRRKVHLVPLLLVAGDHSKNDMAGPGPDSLRSLLERAGFQVSWSLRGLGELPAVRRRFVLRAREAYEAAGFCGAPAD